MRETNMGRGADIDGKRGGDVGMEMEIGREMDWDVEEYSLDLRVQKKSRH